MMKKYLKIKKLYFKTCIELTPKLGHPCVAGVITLHGEQTPPSSRSATKIKSQTYFGIFSRNPFCFSVEKILAVLKMYLLTSLDITLT